MDGRTDESCSLKRNLGFNLNLIYFSKALEIEDNVNLTLIIG